ncbi:MAG: M20/M25/M40 family metallo-hydrolase [Bryobacteraceae bacterium]
MLKSIFAVCALSGLILIPARAEERVDLGTIHQIKSEAFQNSKVMDTMFYLTDANGPRVTNSPGYFAAADWVVKQLKEWGIPARTEKWGPFGRGWTFTRFSAHLVEPVYAPLIGYPQAWTSSTNGSVTGEPMLVEKLTTDEDLGKWKGKLNGKIVLIGAPVELKMNMAPQGCRYTDAELADVAGAPDPGATFGFRGPARPGAQPGGQPSGPEAARQFQTRLQQFLSDEHPLVVVRSGQGRSEGGTVFGGSSGSRELKDPVAPPTIVLTPEHYNRIVRLLDHKIPVKVEVESQTKFFDDRTDSVNVVGEIEGGSKKDQVVMIGAHLDSWQGGTGATDNAAGSAVMIETMRILKTLNLKMDRTVRLALWGGEEEGLLGSKAYVKEHFGDPETMKLGAEHAKLDGYFNVDNGSGKIRGVYLQGNEMMRPIFESWLAPFHDLGASTISIRNTGGTDHLSFDAVGLPGFQFIQEPLEYNSRTHHSNMDVYDRIQAGDLMQMAAIVASVVYNTATRDETLPRKPLPKPQPRRGSDTARPSGAGAAN